MSDMKNNDVNGAGIDLRAFDGSVVVLSVGKVTDGTHSTKIQESG